MGCSCGSTKNGAVSGCNNNGACNTGGCNKMNVFDWLSNMEMPREDKFNVVEVRFKNGRKDFFVNSEKLTLITGDAIVVEVPSGHHIGHVSMQGELVRLQMQKKKVPFDSEIKKIYRIAHQKDLEKFEEVKKRELPTLYRTREIIRDIKLEMKLSDVEYQADNAKATFFYSADDRVDFRELIKLLAGEFKIRVEMRQISLRQEAGQVRRYWCLRTRTLLFNVAERFQECGNQRRPIPEPVTQSKQAFGSMRKVKVLSQLRARDLHGGTGRYSEG
jgi:hypothetical protein